MSPGQGCPKTRDADRRVLTGRRYNTPVMLVLGIETSCDETAAAVVEDGALVLSNVISTQVDIHARYGGVVPEVASRQHMLQIVPVVDLALEQAKVGWDDVDAIAVTKGPGLGGITAHRREHGQGTRPGPRTAPAWSQPPGGPRLCQLAGQGRPEGRRPRASHASASSPRAATPTWCSCGTTATISSWDAPGTTPQASLSTRWHGSWA